LIGGNDTISDVLVARYAADGSYVIATRFMSGSGNTVPTSMTLLRPARRSSPATLVGIMDFGCGIISPPKGFNGTGGFLVKLDAKAKCIWSHAFGFDQRYDQIVRAAPSGDVYVAGTFEGFADFGGGSVGSGGNGAVYFFLDRVAADGTHLSVSTWLAGNMGPFAAAGGLAIRARQ